MSLNLKEINVPQRFLEAFITYCHSNDFIEKVLLFGSRARGDYDITSDIDLAIQTNRASHSEQNLIDFDIQEIPIHLKIDIVFCNRLNNQKFISNIKKDGVIIYEQRKTIRDTR